MPKQERPVAVNIIGLHGVGKTTLSEALAKHYDILVYKTSGAIRRFAAAHNLALDTPEAYLDIRRQMRREDPDAIVRTPLSNLDKYGHLIIDGMQVQADAARIAKVASLRTIALTTKATDNQKRWQRIVDDELRRGTDTRRTSTLQDLHIQDQLNEVKGDPNEPRVSAIMALADISIDAMLDREEVFSRAVTYLDPLLRV